MRARLLAEMQTVPTAPILSPYTRFMRTLVYVQRPALAALLVLVLVGGGTAFAAERALPGDALYGVKVSVIEPAIGSLQSTPSAQADWQVHLASTRLAEASVVANSPSIATSTKTALATRVALASQQAAQEITALAPSDPDAAGVAATALDATFSAHTETLAALTTSADASASPVLAAALSSTVAPAATLALNTAETAQAPTPAPTAAPSMQAKSFAPMMAPAATSSVSGGLHVTFGSSIRVMSTIVGTSSSIVGTSSEVEIAPVIAPEVEPISIKVEPKLSIHATVTAMDSTSSPQASTQRETYDRAAALFAHTRALARLHASVQLP